MPVEISLPFRLGLDGRIVVESNPDRQIKQHVESLVATEPGERVMLPTYGVPTTSLVFEPDDDFISGEIKEFVENGLRKWEPGVHLRRATPIVSAGGDGLAGVAVDYARADGPDATTARHVNTAVIHVGGRVSEVVRG